MSKAGDRTIWDLPADSKIKPIRDLHEELDPTLPCWFTAGQEYVVESMHPIADPPFVKVRINDGGITRLNAEHIKADFEIILPESEGSHR
ncbi:MAG TPA: hypothetical protein ENI98_10095 [Gammaproteobacteria bacterium]|nr:hypothetical protein [Gammaproteobacteria bacterium]